MTTSNVWYACNEHIEIVLDEIVDQQNRAPELLPIEPEEKNQGFTCYWCDNPPVYQLKLD
ncbi:CxxH/CxxC protein [Melghirimyces algeriensis]|uniref:CxxH/CxxC protein, BA_5709 family n=1 Tax=Melghirimyces algeriensis TaxID=910412 RepID=A0A521D9M9_9BACL|nr:CxxH/CxxC protein [Melghirimyces algeriensis]SMO68409.1 CxxH/CxxC protein, BA_5709 family [Melghirimyces algeriensis]